MVYRSVFNINFHHAYFLNNGEEVFTGMAENEKDRILRKYRLPDFLKIVPTSATKNRIVGYRLVFKEHAHGFRVGAKVTVHPIQGVEKYSPLVALPDDLTLTFGLYVTDKYFENYTEIASKQDHTLYLFSNVRPPTEAVDFANIFTAAGNIDPDFLLSEESSRQLVYSIAVEDEFFSSKIDRFSIANLAADDLNTGPGLDLAQRHIQNKKRNGLLGFVRLTVKGDGNNHLLEFDESDPNDVKQYVEEPYPDFTLSFENRKTFWRYFEVSKGNILTTENTKPLVKNGFVQIEAADFDPVPTEELHYPNPTIKSIKKEDSNYFSEIFI